MDLRFRTPFFVHRDMAREICRWRIVFRSKNRWERFPLFVCQLEELGEPYDAFVTPSEWLCGRVKARTFEYDIKAFAYVVVEQVRAGKLLTASRLFADMAQDLADQIPEGKFDTMSVSIEGLRDEVSEPDRSTT